MLSLRRTLLKKRICFLFLSGGPFFFTHASPIFPVRGLWEFLHILMIFFFNSIYFLFIYSLQYHRGLMLLLGAFRTSLAESLYAEANEAPVNIRSHKLALQYYKLKSCKANPAHNNNFYPKYKELFQKNEKAIKPFGHRMGTIIGRADVDLTETIRQRYLGP